MVAAPSSQPGSISALLLRAAVCLLPLLALVAAPAAAQILKCTDGAGNVTYQNEACPRNAKAGRVDIFDNSWTADRAEKDAEWRRNATQHRVVAGMPLKWVREALGEPAEVRDTATAGAAEVWLYNFPDRSVQVGIRDGQVLWSRETPVIASVTRVAPEPDRAPTQVPRAAPGPPPAMPDAVRALPESPRAAPDLPRSARASPKVSESGRGVARGQDCKQALAALGAPDRQREVPAFDSASDPVTEYFYEPAGSENPTRTRIVCANGKVEGVVRTVIR
jgi:hypothetical protein